MAQRPVKIKRYRNMGTRRRRKPVWGRVVTALLVCAAIFAVGWFGASRYLDSLSDLWHRHFSDSQSQQPTPPPAQDGQPQAPDADSDPAPAPPPPAEPDPDATGSWGEIPLSALDGGQQTLRDALQALSQAGADHVLLTLKDERGYIYYDSKVELAVTAGAVRGTADIPAFVQLCGEYGLVPCVRLQAFCDPVAAYADRDAAVFYQRQGVLWLDTAQDLGGKPWLNPYSLTARQYLVDLSKELVGLGVRDILFSGVHFPRGYALQACYYGDENQQVTRTECLVECVSLLQSTLEEAGARAWFEWPAAAAFGQEDPLIYGDGPAAYHALRVFLTPAATRTPEGELLLPDCDATALRAFADAAAEGGTQRLGLALGALAADAALQDDWRSQAQKLDFTHFIG